MLTDVLEKIYILRLTIRIINVDYKSVLIMNQGGLEMKCGVVVYS